VLATPHTRLDTIRHIDYVREVPPCAAVLRLLVSGIAVGAINDHRCVADGVTVLC
jgi:hypothetical protein